MPFSKRINKEVTPKRLYAFLKLVKDISTTKENLEKYIQPLENKSNVFNSVYSFAEKAGLIECNFADIVTLKNIEEKNLYNWDSYRKYMAEIIFKNEDSSFLKLTSWYLEKEKEVFEFNNSGMISEKLKGDVEILNKDDVLGWRFWAEFLGIGFLSNSIIIPNMYKRIKDIIESSECIEKNIELPIATFIDVLLEHNEFKKCIDGNNIKYGVSNGLRTLHDQKFIKLVKTSDSTDVWHLYRMEHEIVEDVTGIIINR